MDRIRDNGGRVTLPRRMVVEAMLTSHDHHLTAAEVFVAVQAIADGVHESTVYRTLDRLVELGAVERVAIGAGPAIYHLPARSHHHLLCESCGEIIEADGTLLDDVARKLKRAHGFELRTEATTLHGRCRDCATAFS
jgi:Fur family ferric uptake transcriptional regulator